MKPWRKLGIATGICRGKFAARLCIDRLRPCRSDGTARAQDGRSSALHAFVEVDRVHFRQYLTRLDLVAHIDQHPQHPSCAGWPDQVAALRLDRANAEQRGCQVGFFGHGQLVPAPEPAGRYCA